MFSCQKMVVLRRLSRIYSLVANNYARRQASVWRGLTIIFKHTPVKYWSIEVMDGILVIHMMYVPTPLTTQPSIAVAGSGWPWLRLRSITCHLWPAPGLCPVLPIMPGLRCTIEDLRWRDVIISFLHSPNDTFHQPPIFSQCICIEGCRDAGMVLWSAVSIYLQYWYHTANVTW